jgi:hypothetical protein
MSQAFSSCTVAVSHSYAAATFAERWRTGFFLDEMKNRIEE